jgi:hypothetical protein
MLRIGRAFGSMTGLSSCRIHRDVPVMTTAAHNQRESSDLSVDKPAPLLYDWFMYPQLYCRMEPTMPSRHHTHDSHLQRSSKPDVALPKRTRHTIRRSFAGTFRPTATTSVQFRIWLAQLGRSRPSQANGKSFQSALGNAGDRTNCNLALLSANH